MNMGHRASVSDIMAKLHTRYGSVLSVEALTEKLHALKQGQEDVSAWAFNIEEVVFEIEEKDGMLHSEVEERVRSCFWYGL